MSKLIVLTVLGLSSLSAFAGPAIDSKGGPVSVTSPDSLPLMAIGAIAAIAAWAIQRSNKK
jgi:hypothetical protein